MLKKIDVSSETKEYAPYIRVKSVNGKFYLYEITDTYNTATKKKKSKSKYIHKILQLEDIKNITRKLLLIPFKEPIPKAISKSLIKIGEIWLKKHFGMN